MLPSAAPFDIPMTGFWHHGVWMHSSFIDADKENYGLYYDAALRLVRVGGHIIVDNTLRLGRVFDDEDHEDGTVVMRELNTRIVGDERVDRVMLPIGDGVTLVRRRLGDPHPLSLATRRVQD